AGHEIHAVGEVLPGAGDVADVGLPTQLAFGADLASHAGHFGRERAELIDHRVHRVLQLQDFAADIDRDLFRQVAVGHGGGHFGDLPDVLAVIAGHGVHAIGQVFPGAGNPLDIRLPA